MGDLKPTTPAERAQWLDGDRELFDVTEVERLVADLDRAEAVARRAHLALALVKRWLGKSGDANATFEDIAAWFHAETGMLRPGKDDPVGGPSNDDRATRWIAWRDAKQYFVRELVVLTLTATAPYCAREAEADTGSTTTNGGES